MTARLSTAGVVRAILGAQIAIARDLSGAAWPRLELGPSAPRLDQPVAPGDQTRRYRLPSEPGRRTSLRS